jgi:hypothetical protein
MQTQCLQGVCNRVLTILPARTCKVLTALYALCKITHLILTMIL